MIDQSLCEVYGLTPHQVDDLTIPEIAVLCRQKQDDDEGSKQAHIHLKNRLTPEERLAAMTLAAGATSL